MLFPILQDRAGGSKRSLRNEVDTFVFESQMTSTVSRAECILSKCGLNTPVFVMANEYKKGEKFGPCPSNFPQKLLLTWLDHQLHLFILILTLHVYVII